MGDDAWVDELLDEQQQVANRILIASQDGKPVDAKDAVRLAELSVALDDQCWRGWLPRRWQSTGK